MLLSSTDQTFASLYLGLPYVRLRWCTVQSRCYRLIGGVQKFGHIGEFMQDPLHWLSATHQQVLYRVSTIARCCILALPLLIFRNFLSFLRRFRVGDRFARPGSELGAPLSSFLEGVLYKFHR